MTVFMVCYIVLVLEAVVYTFLVRSEQRHKAVVVVLAVVGLVSGLLATATQ